MTFDLDFENRLVITADDASSGFDLAALATRLQAAGADVQVERENGEVRLVVALRREPETLAAVLPPAHGNTTEDLQ